ncbi:MAG: 4Fe-4S dicluster domain-containing protein [Acidobacteria bacterium]|nr:4Fe-4S dicluster domain-containing protein [Acidobacteriota bacterium]
MPTQRFGMVIDPERCIHCAACLVACKAENAVPDGHSRNRLSEQESGAYPSVRVVMAPSQCMQCDDAPCVRVCPTGASYRDANGVVLINADDCIGCRYCVEACPYGARYFDEESGTVDKCTFCVHRVEQGLEPACVTTCPTKTRVFGNLDDPSSAVARLIASAPTEVRLPEAGTRPKIYYMRGDSR